MEKITAVMASWEAFLLAFAAFAIIGVIRRAGTKKDKDGNVVGGWAQSKPFSMFMDFYPYIFCGGMVFVPGIPLPEKLEATIGAKVLYAIYCGWLSDKSFAIVKRVLEKGLGMKFGADKNGKK